MLCRQGLGWWSVLLMGASASAYASAQENDVGLVIQVEAVDEADAEDQDANDLDDDEKGEEAAVKQEITVAVKRDGKTLTVTQTVDGDFTGEIVEQEEPTAVKAKSLKELKEKFPAVHAAFTEQPANPVAKPGAAANVSVQMTDNNGDRKVEAKEPGRKIVIREQRGKKLEITVQQDLKHGTRTTRYDAPHFDALRKSHPDIAQLVKLYRDGAIGFGGAVNLQVQAVPLRVPQIRAPQFQPRQFQAPQFRAVQIGGSTGPVAGPRKIVGEHDGRQVVINDENGKTIRMKLAKTVNGKEESEEFEAEDYAELKQKHPEIARIYEKLAGKGLPLAQNKIGVIVNGKDVPVQWQVQPVPVPAVPAAPLPAAPTRDLQFVKQLLERSQQRLERLAIDPKFADGDALKKLAEEIAATVKKLEELEQKSKR